jgi:FixJ family two-component response regulator
LREPLIAVVDDDESFRTALVDSLDSLGYGARGFASAEDFMVRKPEMSFDCVITDVHMPGAGGLDLARLVTTSNGGVPVIMVTALSDPSLDARAAASGAICLLRKPFEAAALIDCLERALKASQLRPS